METKRTDIKTYDVFISWTGEDRAVKDRIVEYLEKNDITCLESDHLCSGDFRQWSREAVKACNVFLLIGSMDTFNSKYVPIEIDEFKKLENFNNRIVPVWLSKEASDKEPWKLKKFASAVILDEQGLTEGALEDVLSKVVSLNTNHLERVYREASKTEFIKLIALSKTDRLKDRDVDFSSLYINRTVCEIDEKGDESQKHESTDIFFKEDNIFFIYGPAGCGKSQYVNQLRQNAPEDVVVIQLNCSKLLYKTDIFTAAFNEFGRICGNRYFYSEENFKSLLRNRRIMLVFDGMDEVPALEQKRALILNIEEFYKANKENTILVFTGRSVADADLIAINGKKVCRFLLQKLNDDEIRSLSRNLFLCFGKENEAEAFFVKVSDLDEEIRSNPLLLSQLAIIYDAKNEIPTTAVGIYDAITEITFGQKVQTENIPAEYKNMITDDISDILKDFSKERYNLLSIGKNIAGKKILKKLVDEKGYKDNVDARTEYLWDYLNSRAIFIEGEFYHKMLLEYFTAVKYYEEACDYYDELKNKEVIGELFSHYKDPYWSAVIKMLLIKADSRMDEETTTALYRYICTLGICDYTLLFDTCKDLLCHKEQAQTVLVADILKKSAEGEYPAYGPLFWYVPEYGLYEHCLLALQAAKEEPGFAHMLCLVRDVCFIMGNKYTTEYITDTVDGKKLFECAKAGLSGVRKALCELFCLGATDYEEGTDIFPRCFNVAEAKSFMEYGCGMVGRMTEKFEDEADLFSHEAYSELNDEFIGIVACKYDVEAIEDVLTKKSCSKLTGLILQNSENTKMEYISINRKHLRVMYVPENIVSFNTSHSHHWRQHMLSQSTGVGIVNDALLYYSPLVCWPDHIPTIPSGYFKNARLLKGFIIPESVTEIGDSAFENCSSLQIIDIYAGVKKIGEHAFSGCSSLETLDIPDSVTEIGSSAFSDCSSLKTFRIPDGVTEIGSFSFSGCSSLETINIPDSVTQIGDYAFSRCSSLEVINIPDSVTQIGGHAFASCKLLKTLNIPDGVIYIDYYAFSKCSSLETIHIPDGVTAIGNSAFSRCSSLETINIPDGVTQIGKSAFEDCTSLKSISIPDSVTEIGDFAFNGCNGLSFIEISEKLRNRASKFFKQINPEIIVFRAFSCAEDDDNGNVICQELEIPFGTRKIDFAKFYGQKNIRTVSLPPTVKSIGDEAFRRCGHMEKINIPDSVTSIGASAFRECTSLKSISIPDSVTEIGQYAFEGCSSLAFVEISERFILSIPKIFGHYNPEIIEFRPLPYTEATEEENAICSEIKIPFGTTEIGFAEFYGQKNIRTVLLPPTVKSIGKEAFCCCSLMERINIPNSVTAIGASAFRECASLKAINIPDSLTEIGSCAFEGCQLLKTINISGGVTQFDDYAFSDCVSLEAIHIPNGVTRIGRSVFKFCISLKTINLPDSVTEIGEFAFDNCKSLKSINIPDAVAEICDCTFSGCKSLESINIPDSVTKIGTSAFFQCSSLEAVNIPDSVAEIGDRAFYGVAINSVDIPTTVRIIGDSAFHCCTNLSSIKISHRFEDDIDRIFGDIDRSIITFIN